MKSIVYAMCIAMMASSTPLYADLGQSLSILRSDIIFDAWESLNPLPVKANNGDLVVCFGETGDAEPGGRCQFVRSTDGGTTWSQTPYLTFQSKYGQYGAANGSLSKAPNGTIVLALTDSFSLGEHWQYTSVIEIYTSTDNGQTFPATPTAIVPTHPSNGNWPSAPVRYLANGDWILPGYYRNNAGGGDFPCGFWRSTDAGLTWNTHELVFPNDWRAFNEIDIVVRADKSLLAVVRTDAIDSGFEYSKGQLFYAESFDHGYTWTAPQLMGIPGHSPSMIRLPDGAIMLGCRRLSSTGNFTSVYFSRDGVNFEFLFNAAEPRAHRNSATGYPYFTMLNNEDIYMAFYAGDTTLSWPTKTYCAGNVIRYKGGLYIGPTGCGDLGYLTADINLDCKVNLLDIALIVSNWLSSTNPESLDFVDCTDPVNKSICQDL